MEDFIKRLRDPDARTQDDWDICNEAADEIERLREALEYIVEYCEDPVLYRENKIELTLHKARAALGRKSDG